MRKISVFTVLFKKPIETFVTAAFIYFMISTLLGAGESGLTGDAQIVVMGVSGVLSLLILRWFYNRRALSQMEKMQKMQGVTGRKKKHSLLGSLLFGTLNAGVNMSKGMNRMTDQVSRDITNSLMSGFGAGRSSSSNAAEREAWERRQAADRAAFDRWKAQDSAKWHEWHAMDQAKKGHAGGAAYHSNKADYYRNKY